jgi:DNA (cytosine-5)-methyltransferase 1
MKADQFTLAQVADILSVSKSTLTKWDKNDTLKPTSVSASGAPLYSKSQLMGYEEARKLFESNWDEEIKVSPARTYTLVELFAGAGGMAIGMEKAGLDSILLNEIDKHACATLRKNRPEWNVVEGDISEVSFKEFKGQVDVLTGGFPCQAFSYAGKKLGFEDTRGTLFFEFARAVKETKPKIIVAENVRGLLKHDGGRTLETICSSIDELGYALVPPTVLKAVFYQVPQKRERLLLVAIRKDLAKKLKKIDSGFKWPSPYKRIMTMKDALKKGALFKTDVPESIGQLYPKKKEKVLKKVPEGGYWRDLPIALQKEYMQKSFYLGGGKTGMARRLAWDEPSLTLTCSPAQKQTERCHPDETRPLTVREYARIQTFPDEWAFEGPMTAQYKQIGNAVPVNLAYAVGRSLIRVLNEIESLNTQ